MKYDVSILLLIEYSKHLFITFELLIDKIRFNLLYNGFFKFVNVYNFPDI